MRVQLKGSDCSTDFVLLSIGLNLLPSRFAG
jgi:hypothetical protein